MGTPLERAQRTIVTDRPLVFSLEEEIGEGLSRSTTEERGDR